MSTDERIKKITDIIIEWTKQKAEDGKIEFDETFSTNDTIRYRTKEMTKRFPDNPKEGKGWSLGYLKPYPHYFYEIECMSTTLRLKLAFHANDIMPITTKNKCNSIMEKYMNHPLKKDEFKGTLYRIPCIFSCDINERVNENDIRNEMDKLYYQMMGYESCILNNISEE